jgi:hypothetical protein
MPASLCIEFRKEHYPFWMTLNDMNQGPNAVLTARSPRAQVGQPRVRSTSRTRTAKCPLVEDLATRNLASAELREPLGPRPIGTWTILFEDNRIEELWLAVAVSCAV